MKKKGKNKGTSVVSKAAREIPSIEKLEQTRIGGSVNFRGIAFQLIYAVYTIMSRISQDRNAKVKLEGIEDIDVFNGQLVEHIQTKSSINSFDAGTVWDLGILQNFMDVFINDQTRTFKLVHNSHLAKGKLEILGGGTVSDETKKFWLDKFLTAGYSIDSTNVDLFFSKVSAVSEKELLLEKEVIRLLYDQFEISNDTEAPYLNALYYNVFEWSKSRATIGFDDLQQLIEEVKGSFAHFVSNPAALNAWLTRVSYSDNLGIASNDYYEGKAARPIHIALGLPVIRQQWQSSILTGVERKSVTVIKSSSGQGKSTLAWQTGFHLLANGYTIYQLNQCLDWHNARPIADFLETKLKIGEQILLVVDGLTNNVAGWQILADLLVDKPVRMIITSREEDWYRFGGDDSKSSIHFVDIQMDIVEAEKIYHELKRNGKINADINSWQPAWEKTKERGLLIEYVYLLTSGEMIRERLAAQVKDLNKETGAAAKIEVLRMISLADALNIKIRTADLTNYINDTIRFDTDRNEVYKQLEKEYFVRFDSEFVEGLHPVRSRHLVTLLHSTLPISESLAGLLTIIDSNQTYDFFISAPEFLDATNKEGFYKKAGDILAKRSFPEMVYAIDGLMHFEPNRYWQENRKIYDEVYLTGALNLFVYDSVPFNSQKSLPELSASIGNSIGSNIALLVEKAKDLSAYDLSQSDVLILIKHLHSSLTVKRDVVNPEGITFLLKWFKKAGFTFPDILNISEESLMKAIERDDINHSSDLFHFYSITNPSGYASVMSKHRERIISFFKKKTNTLTCEVKENDLHMTYVLDANADKTNEQSVYRINIAHAIFPGYDHYCTEVVVLPFPTEQIYAAVILDGHKNMPKENLFDNFDIHINQIWSKSIINHYSAASMYEWQKQYYELRNEGVEVIKKCVRLFEAHILNDEGKAKSMANTLAVTGTQWLDKYRVVKKLPAHNQKYFDQDPFPKEMKGINDFFTSVNNFLNQLGGVFQPKTDRDRNLPIHNLKQAVERIPSMQESFASITAKTHNYFDFTKIEPQENIWYLRLSKTAQYFLHRKKSDSVERVIVPSQSIDEWWIEKEKQDLAAIHNILDVSEMVMGTKFVYPTAIITEEPLRTVAIGIKDFDFTNSNEMLALSVTLKDLCKTGVHYFVLCSLNDNNEITTSLRCTEAFFEHFWNFTASNDPDDLLNLPMPLPFIPDKELLSTIPGAVIKPSEIKTGEEGFYKLMTTIWKLGQYRENLIVSHDKAWLQELEFEYNQLIEDSIRQVAEVNEPISAEMLEKIQQFMRGAYEFSNEEIIETLIKRLVRVDEKVD